MKYMRVIRINQDGTMHDINIPAGKKSIIKKLNNNAIKKGSTNLKELYKWSIEDKELYCYGWYDGDPGFENKHDLLPNGNSSFLCDEDSSEILLYGDIFIVALNKISKKLTDFCVSDYAAVYEILFEGFDDCNTDEESEDSEEETLEEEEASEEDKQFINDNSDLSEEEYSDIELDIDENIYTDDSD